MTGKERFISASEELVTGLLREAIGYRVEYPIPYYKGVVGFMVEAPMLWIRHSRFPILTIAYDSNEHDVINDVVKQLELARATEYFALLIVVPTRIATTDGTRELRRLLSNSVYRYDFVVLDREQVASIIARNSAQRLIEIILEQGIELSTLSPYVVRGPVPETMFFGREKEVKLLAQKARSGDQAVVGGRRIGKSSILLKLTRLFNNEPRYRAIYTNCEDKFTGAELIQALLPNTAEQQPSIALRMYVRNWKERNPGRTPVLLFDEIDELLAHDSESSPPARLFKTLRAMSHEGECRFIFSGSRLLYRHLNDPTSPFFNFCEHLVLGNLDERSVAEIFSKPMKQLGIELIDEEFLIDRIIDLSSCHPNIAQWICDRLIKRLTARIIRLEDLDTLARDVEFINHYVQTAWGEASDLEKFITVIMEPEGMTYEELLERLANYNCRDEVKIALAVQLLELSGLLERCEGIVRFRMAHFQEFVRDSEVGSALLAKMKLGQGA